MVVLGKPRLQSIGYPDFPVDGLQLVWLRNVRKGLTADVQLNTDQRLGVKQPDDPASQLALGGIAQNKRYFVAPYTAKMPYL